MLHRSHIMKFASAGLRFRLMVLLLLAILPTLSLTIYLVAQERRSGVDAALRQSLYVARMVSARQLELIEGTRQLLAAFAHLPELRHGDSNACSALLVDLLREHPRYSNFAVVSPNGDQRCSSLPVSGPVTYSDRDWFRQVVHTRQFVAGGYVMGRITGKPLAAFAYPILDESGAIQAIIVAGLDLSRLNDLIADVQLAPEYRITVLDRNGAVLADNHDGEKLVGKSFPESEVLRMVLAHAVGGSVESEGVDGSRRLYSFVRLDLPEDTEYVVVGIPTTAAHADVARALLGGLALSVAVALLTLTAAWFGVDLLVLRPMKALLVAMRRVTGGDLRARTGIPHGADEFGRLAAVFDEMAATLEAERDQRERWALALQKSEERLSHLLTVSPAVIYTLSPDGSRLTWVSPNITTLLGYAPEEMLAPGWWSDRLHPEDRDEAIAALRRATGSDHVVGEYRLARRGGEFVWIRDELTVVRDTSGNRAEMIGVWTNITDRKQLEIQLQQQLRAVSALWSGALSLVQRLEPRETAQEVARLCVEQFMVDVAWVGLREPDGRVTMVGQYPPDHPYPGTIVVRWDETPEGEGPTGRAIRSGNPQVAVDLLDEHTFLPWRHIAEIYGFRSAAALPLTSRGHTLGSLNLYSQTPAFFSGDKLDTFQALASQAAAALENARLYAETHRRLAWLQALRNIDMAITGSLDLRVTLGVLLDEVTKQLKVDAAALLLLDPSAGVLRYAAGRGFRTRGIERTRVRLGEGYAGRSALERRALGVNDLSRVGDFARRGLLEEEGFVACWVVPMIAKGRVLGVLETFHRSPVESGEEWLELLEALARQAAIAFENAQLVDDLRRARDSLLIAYDATIEGWSRALDLRDKETEGHSQRVTDLTVKLAREIGMGEEEIVHVRRGALLHDMGKIGIPDAVLLKPGPLTTEEWDMMRQHPWLAYELLSPIEYLRPALDIPYCHHEKWDGSGYPRGLKAEEIPLAARLFAVADVWDALTSDRPYRKAWDRERALEYIRQQAGKHFDPRVVELFSRTTREEMEHGRM